VRFDPTRLEVLGEPVSVVAPVFMRNNDLGAAEYAVSRQGTLVYALGGQAGNSAKSLVWVNRQGQEEAISGAPSRAYLAARISPDGTRVALDIRDQPYGIWVLDIARRTMTRLTEVPGVDPSRTTPYVFGVGPTWTPDGRRIIFSSSRAGVENLF